MSFFPIPSAPLGASDCSFDSFSPGPQTTAADLESIEVWGFTEHDQNLMLQKAKQKRMLNHLCRDEQSRFLSF